MLRGLMCPEGVQVKMGGEHVDHLLRADIGIHASDSSTLLLQAATRTIRLL